MSLADPPIRAALVRDVVPGLIDGDPDGFWFHEMGLCEHRARVDLAVFNGHIHGIEIKSDRDTFARLDQQAEVYNAVLDLITVVVGEAHEVTVESHVDEWWGISVAREGASGVLIDRIRPPEQNPQRDAEMIAHLLWRDEAVELLDRLGCARGVRSKPRYFVCKRLSEALPIEDLSREVRQTIKARGDWRATPS
ncbi:sce7726 family protein [Rubrivirga marina]|uniref:sce7726 family protein n=1 Tax=Rubrivirga marina TaxID=1196024 RepID=UPI000BA90FC8|nr:sce7726 family protein [Rubrivirga marina]